MGKDVYKLGDGEAMIKFDPSGTPWIEFSDKLNRNPQPHELHKIAHVLEEAKRAKDYEQKKFTDNDDVTGYIK